MTVNTPINRSLIPKSHPPHYLMHKYWARKPHNVVREYIKYFSQPAELILDPFSGSGVTLIEALITGRKAIAIDINPIATLITQATVSAFDKNATVDTFDEIKEDIKGVIDSYFSTRCTECSAEATVAYYVWENLGECPSCKEHVPLGSVKRKGRLYVCPHCGSPAKIHSEDIVGERIIEIYYSCKNCNTEKTRKKIPDNNDIEKLKHFDEFDFDPGIGSGHMFVNRRTLVYDETSVETYFTRRNLYLLSLLKKEIDRVKDKDLGKLFQFIFTSGVAQASRLIPYRNNLTTGGPAWSVPGFWIPNIHLERNPWNCFANRAIKVIRGKEKLAKIMAKSPYSPARSFSELSATGNAWIINKSATAIADLVPDTSVDYIFTDPPYGDSVPYLEFSSIWNAWLGYKPDYENEIVISDSRDRNKNIDNYQMLLSEVFAECYRVLKPGKWLSVTFHNRNLETWKAIIRAATNARFRLINSVYQAPAVIPSKAQFARAGSSVGDIILNFRKIPNEMSLPPQEETKPIEELILATAEQILAERGGTATTDQLLRGIILALLEQNQMLVLERDIQKILAGRFDEKDSYWFLRQEDEYLIHKYAQIYEIVRETVINCRDKGIKDKKKIIAEVFSTLTGSQTPDIGMIMEIITETDKKNNHKQLKLF